MHHETQTIVLYAICAIQIHVSIFKTSKNWTECTMLNFTDAAMKVHQEFRGLRENEEKE